MSRPCSDLITWLRQQLDDDERLARKAASFKYDLPSDAPWERERIIADAVGGSSRAVAVHRMIAVFADPARVLAEVEAKRRILDDLASTCDWVRTLQSEGKLGEAAPYSRHAGSLLGVVKVLAQPYAGRDGWQEEWRV